MVMTAIIFGIFLMIYPILFARFYELPFDPSSRYTERRTDNHENLLRPPSFGLPVHEQHLPLQTDRSRACWPFLHSGRADRLLLVPQKRRHDPARERRVNA